MRIHSKLLLCLAFVASVALLTDTPTAHADEADAEVLEQSSSGQVIRVALGRNQGLRSNDPILLMENGQRVAAARIVRADENSSIAYIVEDFEKSKIILGQAISILYGMPLDDVPELPEGLFDDEEVRPNPSDEKLTPDEREFRPRAQDRVFTPDGREVDPRHEEEVDPYQKPDVDSDRYQPERSIRPRYPNRPDYSAHNLTLGVGIFRDLETTSTSVNSTYTTHQGWAARYGYVWESHLWFQRKRNPALFSLELGWGTYNFVHAPAGGGAANVRVMPLQGSLRWLIRVNRMFKIYPYAGYQRNLVSSTTSTTGTDLTSIARLRRGRLIGGAGAMLVTSESTDARVEGGVDGFLLGLVVKF